MSRTVSNRGHFSRRSLLSGLGAGAALLGPFLRHRSALAAPAQSGNLLVFFTPNGHKRNRAGSGPATMAFDAASTATGMTLGSSLAPLMPFVNDISVIKGLNLKTPTFIASHQDICRILTCQNAPGGQSKEGTAHQFTGYGPSIDQSIGMAINQRPLVVAVDPYRDQPHWRTFLSWRASGVNEPFVKNFQTVFTDIFGALTGQVQNADQVAALARARARNKSLLDFVNADIATFRTRINSNDRAHLDAYLDALRTVEQKVTEMPTVAGTCTTDPLKTRIGALGAAAPIQNDDKSPDGVAAEMQKRGELWMDMIASAFACGSRRIAVMQWQGASEGYDVGANTGSPNHHSVSHYAFGGASEARWLAIDTWYSERFAYMLNALKTLGVLDRTVIAWVSEITEAHHQLNMVSVVAGGQALGMKMGQYIKYPFKGNEIEGSGAIAVGRDPANRSLSDLWVTCQQAMGVPSATFGDPTVSAGPLTELRTA
jgi:hypothetical protein